MTRSNASQFGHLVSENKMNDHDNVVMIAVRSGFSEVLAHIYISNAFFAGSMWVYFASPSDLLSLSYKVPHFCSSACSTQTDIYRQRGRVFAERDQVFIGKTNGSSCRKIQPHSSMCKCHADG